MQIVLEQLVAVRTLVSEGAMSHHEGCDPRCQHQLARITASARTTPECTTTDATALPDGLSVYRTAAVAQEDAHRASHARYLRSLKLKHVSCSRTAGLYLP